MREREDEEREEREEGRKGGKGGREEGKWCGRCGRWVVSETFLVHCLPDVPNQTELRFESEDPLLTFSLANCCGVLAIVGANTPEVNGTRDTFSWCYFWLTRLDRQGTHPPPDTFQSRGFCENKTNCANAN